MKIKYNEESGVERVPVAFIDNEGDLWIRSTHEENLMDNDVNIIIKKTNEVIDYCDMEEVIGCITNKYSDIELSGNLNHAVKNFYEGDSITIIF